MKRQNIYLYILLIILFACEKDETIVKINSDAKPAVITSTATDLSPTINEETLKDEVTINWNETEYGIDTEVNYTIEIDLACNSFANPIVLGSTTNNSLTVSLEMLNNKLLNDLKLAQHFPAELQVRVTSVIKNNFSKTSEPVTFTITPWNAWSNGLWLLSSSWDDKDAPAIYVSGGSIYEGYVWLSSEDQFKFADKRICGKTLFGGSDGQLSSDASANSLSVGTTGYYKLNVDTENLTYAFTLIETIGVIGTATPGGWGSSTALTYNDTDKTWSADIDLTGGALKFRANDAWTINYGPADGNALVGTLVFDDPGAVNIQDAGNYTINVDFSKTKSPGYIYSITKNLGGPPSTLWLPGEYQGWNPSTAPTIKSVTANAYEGYVYISAATGYKFTSAPDWDHINYGDAGTPGVLTTDGLANGMGLSEAGYYKFNVNVSALTYTAVLINTMGMIGTATPGSWDSSTAMTYDIANDVWKGTVNLVPGALKFRANNEWTINYGPADAGSLTGTLIFDDPGAINITEAGNYTVTVDFSRGTSPYKYAYSVVKN
jgi:hypothetical protein